MQRKWRFLLLIPLAYLAIVILLMLLEDSLLYFPAKYPDGDWNPTGLVFEDAWFEADDGAKLHGWYVGHESPRAVILFAHGNAGNLSHRADLYAQLHRLGASVLAFDYRGYGRSQGTPNEKGVIDDAKAARKWLANRVGISEQDIIVMGESLGGAVAVALAADAPARALVLENTFSSAPDVAACHYRWLPVRQLMRTRLDSVNVIGKYHGPLLQFHGGSDTIVPLEFGKKLFDAANEPKKFVLIPGADHNDPRTPQFYRELEGFLASLPLAGFSRDGQR